MSSRRLRALRNRQNRNQTNQQLKAEAKEPQINDLNADNANTETTVQEPALDLQKATETVAPKVEEKASDSFTEGLSATPQEDVVESSAELSSIMDVSPLEQAKAALAQNPQTSLDFGEELIDEPKVAQESAPQVQTQAQEHLEETPNLAPQNVSSEALDTDSLELAETKKAPATLDEADTVPVQPSLSNDEVPNRPGAILMHARELLGLSLNDVAHRLNLRVNTVSDIEHDRLNQVTAVPFTSKNIAAYAKLVNIDPNVLVNLYMDCVKANVKAQEFESFAKAQNEKAKAKEQKAQKSSSDDGISYKKVAVAIAALVIVVVAAFAAYSAFTTDSQDSEGTLVLEDQVPATVEEDGSLNLNTQDSKITTRVEEDNAPIVEDANTALAKQQSAELDTNAIISQSEKSTADTALKSSNETLHVKNMQVEQTVAADAEIAPVEENPFKSVKLNSANEQKKAQTSTAKLDTKVAQVSDNKVKVDTTPIVPNTVESKPQVKEPTAQVQTVKAQPQVKTPTVQETVKTEPKKLVAGQVVSLAQEQRAAKNNTAVTQTTTVAPAKAVSLSNSTRNVSARLKGKRDPFTAPNSVNIRVLGDIAIKVTGNGKVIKQGTYKKGQSITAIGIPPLKVSVSDSSKVSISYVGTTVAVPRGEQVSFELPQR